MSRRGHRMPTGTVTSVRDHAAILHAMHNIDSEAQLSTVVVMVDYQITWPITLHQHYRTEAV